MTKPRFSFHRAPYVAAPNVRINGGRIVHSGQWTWVRSLQRHCVVATCHSESLAFVDGMYTSDPASCSHCAGRSRRARTAASGNTVPVPVTRLRLELWRLLEEEVLLRYPILWRWRLRISQDEAVTQILKELRDLNEIVAEAVTDEDADLVRACIEVGAERIVELRAGLDCEPDETDELFGTAA